MDCHRYIRRKINQRTLRERMRATMNEKKILGDLYTARWNASKAIEKLEAPGEIPYKEIELYIKSISGLMDKIADESLDNSQQEPDRPNNPPPALKKYEIPNIVRVPGVKFVKRGNFKTKSGNARGLVVHYTVSGNEKKNALGVVNWLAQSKLGCLVMDKDGIIYAPEDYDFQKDVVFHAGRSSWLGHDNVSYYNIGMEICCWGLGSKVGPFRESKGNANIIHGKYQAYTDKQEKSLINFCLWQLDVNPEFEIAWIAGHDEIAVPKGRKQDPGASLSMTMPEFRKLIKERAE